MLVKEWVPIPSRQRWRKPPLSSNQPIGEYPLVPSRGGVLEEEICDVTERLTLV